MQAYEGYLENGHFFPFDTEAMFKGRRKVRMTVLEEDEQNMSEKDIMAISSRLMEQNREAYEVLAR
jgi:hypothetical protein